MSVIWTFTAVNSGGCLRRKEVEVSNPPGDGQGLSFTSNDLQSTFDFPGARPKLGSVMPRLAQILAHHGSILVLDAAATKVQTGLLRADREALWHCGDEEAGQAVFAGASTLLSRAGLRLGDVAAFVFCEGPGSMLGIRTTAMTLRTWTVLKPRPCFAYQSLALAAHHEWSRLPRRLTLIADARREAWHVQTIEADGTLAPLQRLSPSELPGGELLTPEHFRTWAQPPSTDLRTCSYELSRLLETAADRDLFRETAAPDAFQHAAPEYRKWSAQVHSAATASRP
jgi:tRNA threonylcarbamoyladenosine biosynthesis protein TsaB